ncbi:MAG: glycosyltransferase family protein, partial [Bacteroidota bacterium]
AWACKLKKIKCISLSHQAAVLNKHFAQPGKIDLLGKAILKNYAPTSEKYGFHFKTVNETVFTPVIRRQVREHEVENKGHYTVYLPAYDDNRILNVLKKCTNTRWQVFSKHNKKKYRVKNITFQPINNEAFIESIATAEGVLCGAGFETPAEVLFMNKKLLVIPMKGQYEQQCNAAALAEMGVPVLKSLKLKHLEKINNWIDSTALIEVDYPDRTSEIVNTILLNHSITTGAEIRQPYMKLYSVNKFRNLVLKKMAAYI